MHTCGDDLATAGVAASAQIKGETVKTEKQLAAARERQRRYVERHPQRTAENSQRYRDNHPERDANNGRRYRSKHPDRVLDQIRTYRKNNPEKYAATTALNHAIERHGMVKGVCEVCGTTVNVQGHHPDYSKPLEVVWLCAKHHQEVHRGSNN